LIQDYCGDDASSLQQRFTGTGNLALKEWCSLGPGSRTFFSQPQLGSALAKATTTGQLVPHAPGRKRGTSKIEAEALRDYVTTHADQSLVQIGHHFGVSGVMIWKRLKQLGFTFNKRPSATKSATKPGDKLSKI
jgi:hypothetical protein